MLQNLQNAVENVGSLPSRCNDSQKPISCEKGVDKVVRISVIADGIRLVNGSSWNKGRVEVYESGGWGSVCSTEWDTMDASVVCKVVGFKYGVAITSGLFGLGGGPVQMTNVSCDGSESSIFGCLYNRTKECPTNQTAGVVCNNGLTIRLMDGYDESEGRVEVLIDNQWGTICEDNWGQNEASVVCRSLGLPSANAVAKRSGYFGRGKGVILLNGLNCSGRENDLQECSRTESGSAKCGHKNDAGVRCAPLTLVGGPSDREGRVEVYTDQQWGTVCDTHWGDQEARVVCENLGYFGYVLRLPVRLVGGQNDREGRVEVYMNHVWGTVCDDDWDHDDAQVVCQSLGFPNFTGVARAAAYFGQGSGPILLDNVRCNGNEGDIRNCSYTMNVNCGHSEDAGVICVPLRLVDGKIGKEGRVEVYMNKHWGTVCNTNWGQNEAQVVCENLGYGRFNAVPRQSAFFGEGIGDIVLHNVRCSGRETALSECQHEVFASTNCSHDNDAGVSCLSVRLFGGRNVMEGRVEIFMRNEWGTICDTLWDSKDGSVVCRSLGYEGFTGVPRYNSFYGKGSGRIWLQNGTCNGDETSIQNCIKSGIGVHQCNHSHDAGVKCVPIRLVNGSSIDEGRVEVYQDNQWSTICGQNWSKSEAQVLCQSLGFGRSTAVSQPFKMNQRIKAKFPTYFDCRGHERNLFECFHHKMPVNTGWYSNDECSQAEVRCIPVRLSGGYNNEEGRVEVFMNNVWGTICDAGWDSVDSRIVCHTLFGYSYGGTKVSTGHFTRGVGDILLANVSCTGSESNVLECKHSLMTDHCTHSKDVAVKCYQNIRLNGGKLEVCVKNKWGTVCSYGWDDADAKVACRSLGLPSKYASARTVYEYEYYYDENPSLLNSVGCRGTESSLFDCSSNSRYCDEYEIAAVDCA
uniref:Deleted in malignant brain tumors 1 protein n=1 Tax=Magallana gigas TaxID=29159 RepID=K1PUY0_MAGGI